MQGKPSRSGSLAAARSRSGSDSRFRLSFNTLAPLRYPERAQELFAKAEATAKAKYERLKKMVDFYS